MILTEYAAQVTAAEEDGAAAVVALETGFFTEVRGYGGHKGVTANQTVASGLVAVYGAEAGAEVTV